MSRLIFKRALIAAGIMALGLVGYSNVKAHEEYSSKMDAASSDIRTLNHSKQELEDQIKTKETQLKEKDESSKVKDDQLKSKDNEIKELNEKLQAKLNKPKATVASTTTYAVGCDNYRDLVAQYNWNVDNAMKVMSLESGCNPSAANLQDSHGVCMGSFGLFQISCHGGQIYDPAQNVAAAYAKYKAGGWQPWYNTAKKLGLL